jgi:hypothetical protein
LVAPAYAQAPDAKLDESLRESVERGCTGTKSVIIRTKPGYRQSLRESLASHGDVVNGEFPALEAVAAVVHCEDLVTLAGFTSTDSVSLNAPIANQTVDLDPAQAVVSAARTALVAAKADSAAKQQAVRAAEKAAASANAQMVAAQRALVLASRLTGATRDAAVAAAQAKLAETQAHCRARGGHEFSGGSAPGSALLRRGSAGVSRRPGVGGEPGA